MKGLRPSFGLRPKTLGGKARTKGAALLLGTADGRAKPCLTSDGRAGIRYVQGKAAFSAVAGYDDQGTPETKFIDFGDRTLAAG